MERTIECLLIEDDIDDHEIFLICIQEINCKINCRTAEDGIEAMEMLRSDSEYIPDYIFIDVNMPKMNGLECLKSIKKMEKLGNTRFFMLSTSAETSVIKESKTLGAEFIIKPPKISALKHQLCNAFEITATV